MAFSHAFQSDYLGTFATVDVTTWLDTVDGNTSSIAALTAVGGAGADNVISLREAIIAVNNGAGGDTIQLGSGDYKLTIMTGTGDAHGDLDIDEDVEIIGMADGSTVIDASLLTGERVFSVVNGDATFQNLTITGGDKIGDGGGIHVESGVQVIVDNVVVTDNSATGSGGGIYNVGTLTVSNSTISDNEAGNSGGGISASNGAIQINNVTVSNNEATNDGGGVFLSNGTHNLTNVTISGNTAGDEGGGVFVRKLATGNHYYNTITDNTAGDKGGGLRNEFSGGTVKVTGSIIAGNRGPTGSPDDVSGTIDPPATSIIGGSTVNLLEPLADNGGPAETHALKPGSLGAINQGGTATAGETDGRGYTIADTIRDIGAFELGGIPPAGTNDAPIITDGPDTVNLTESNAGLAITGDFTVADVDLADSVTAMVDSVVAGGTGLASSSLDNATLTSFLSVSPTAVLNNTQTSNTLTWNFDSANEAFDFLAAGETLILTYTVSVTDDATPSVGTDTETVTVTITGTNDDPVAQVDTNAAIEDGAIVNGTLTNTDEDTNDTHTYSLINGTAKGSATVQSNGNYSFDPGADFQDLAQGETRDVTFTYEVEDNNGATSRADVTITVTGTNDIPMAQAATNTAVEDGAIVNGTLANTDEDTNDTHTYSLINGTANGTALVQSNGDYSFDPGADFQDLALGETRDVTFTYEVEDNNGAKSQAIVTITVTGTNDIPMAQAATNTAVEDGAIVNGTLANTDEDTNDTHTYSLINGTANGTALVQSNGDYSFDPGTDFQDLAQGETRDVTFTYEVEDNNGATSRADVTITVTGTNDDPVAQILSLIHI